MSQNVYEYLSGDLDGVAKAAAQRANDIADHEGVIAERDALRAELSVVRAECQRLDKEVKMLRLANEAAVAQEQRNRVECNRLREDLEEYRQTFSIQWSRMAKATKLWRKETGRHNVSPDLGDLLEWLMDRCKK